MAIHLIDMKCDDCKQVFEYDKGSILNSTPENVKCIHCGSYNTYRYFSSATFDIAEGICGNEKTGYSKGIVNHPSKYGKFKGTRV